MSKSRKSSQARSIYDLEYRRCRRHQTYLDCDTPPTAMPAQINGYRSWCMRHDGIISWSNVDRMVRFWVISFRHAHAQGVRLNVKP